SNEQRPRFTQSSAHAGLGGERRGAAAISIHALLEVQRGMNFGADTTGATDDDAAVTTGAARGGSLSHPPNTNATSATVTYRSITGAEDLLQLDGRCHVELIVTTLLRRFVGAPAVKVRGVPQPSPLHV